MLLKVGTEIRRGHGKGLLHLWGKASFFKVFGEKSREHFLDALIVPGFHQAGELRICRGRIVVNLRFAGNIGVEAEAQTHDGDRQQNQIEDIPEKDQAGVQLIDRGD